MVEILGATKWPCYSKTCVKRPLSKRPKIDFQDQISLNVGQKYCRMLQKEHSAILSTFIKLPFVIKTFVLSILSGRLTQVSLYIQICVIMRSFKGTCMKSKKKTGINKRCSNKQWSNCGNNSFWYTSNQ